MIQCIRCQTGSAAIISGLLLSLALGAAPAPADAIEVALEGTLTAGGAMRGTLTAVWRGRPATDLRDRLKGLERSARDASLLVMLPVSLTGKVGSLADDEGIIRIVYSVDAPRFAAGGGALTVPLPLYAPFDLNGSPAPPLPLTISQDIRIGLPPGMVPVSLPSAFSSVTPTGGRYLLHYDLEGPRPGWLIARRQMRLDAASLGELLETAAAHDTGVTLVASPPGSTSPP